MKKNTRLIKAASLSKKFPIKKKTYTRVGTLKVINDFWVEASPNPQLRFTVVNKTGRTLSKQLVFVGSGSTYGNNQDLTPAADHYVEIAPNYKVQLYLFPDNYVPKDNKICWRVDGYTLD
jgi:hypothetical protein